MRAEGGLDYLMALVNNNHQLERGDTTTRAERLENPMEQIWEENICNDGLE